MTYHYKKDGESITVVNTTSVTMLSCRSSSAMSEVEGSVEMRQGEMVGRGEVSYDFSYENGADSDVRSLTVFEYGLSNTFLPSQSTNHPGAYIGEVNEMATMVRYQYDAIATFRIPRPPRTSTAMRTA